MNCMDPQDYKIINVPMGSTKEDIKAREAIISDVYRKWYEANPSKAAYNTDLKEVGIKNQSEFSEMIIMECPLVGIGIAKLTVGVKKKTEMKIQYCITALST